MENWKIEMKILKIEFEDQRGHLSKIISILETT